MIRSPIAFNIRFLLCLLCLNAIAPGAIPAGALDGTWLVEHAAIGNGSNVFHCRRSVFTFDNGSLTVTHFCGSKNDLHGTFTLLSNDAIDLNVDAIDVSDVWTSATYPSGNVPGIFKLEGDRLTICFETGDDRHRPAAFATPNNKTHLVTLVRARAGFQQMPSTITIAAQDVDGHPVRDASLFTFFSFSHFGGPTTQPSAWIYREVARTDAAGHATLQSSDLSAAVIGVRDERRQLSGFAVLSPVAMAHGTINIVLKAEVAVAGKLASPDAPITWTNVYLYFDGERIAGCESTAGRYGFDIPAGTYKLNAYGTDLEGRYVDLVVPAGKEIFTPPPIALSASHTAVLVNRPAPELTNIHGWVGTPTPLASLRGKYVLLDFWGYWCGPCVRQMPALMRLHERFKDKGLAVIGVHVDVDSDVTTAAELDAKLMDIKQQFWGGKSLPFPVVLSSDLSKGAADVDHSTTPAGLYGIHAYPTTVVIDRNGLVVGTLEVSDEKAAAAQIQKWLDAN